MTELADEPRQAIAFVVQEALTATAADGAAMALRIGQTIECCARAGFLAPPLRAIIDTRSGLSRECLRTGRIVHSDDTETDPRVDVNARGSGIRSAVMVPLVRGGHVAGLFAVFSERPSAFNDRQICLLHWLADLVSVRVVFPSGDRPAPVPVPVDASSTQSACAAPEQSAMKSKERLRAAREQNLSAQWVSSGKITDCLDKIRQDPALQVLGRAKAYLRIEALYDGIDRSHAIGVCERLMFQRAADIGVVL